MDTVRVLRVIEYVGPREDVERIVAQSIHGEKKIDNYRGGLTIRAATVGIYPEILSMEKEDGQVPLQHG